MRILHVILGILFLGNATLVNAATDWTRYLKPILSGCGYVNLPDKLPMNYEASIISKSTIENTRKENSEIQEVTTYITYNLNNAVAFGQPLLKIEFQEGYEWHRLNLYFKDDKFTTLRPQFKLPNRGEGDIGIRENNANGYVVGLGGTLELIFDKKQKSITCHEYV